VIVAGTSIFGVVKMDEVIAQMKVDVMKVLNECKT